MKNYFWFSQTIRNISESCPVFQSGLYKILNNRSRSQMIFLVYIIATYLPVVCRK